MSRDFYDVIGDEMAKQFEVVIGQMFGKPCLKTSNKAFALFYHDEMVFKLGKDEVALLKNKYPGSVNFDPSGKNRPMKDWLQIPSEFKDDWMDLARQAREYVEENK